MPTLLDVTDLNVQFHTIDGIVRAVNGVSFSITQGETLGIVGESGCGKSVTMLSIMRLIPQPPGKITAGKVLYQDRDLLQLPFSEIEHIRGKEMAMIFQDPMTSFNPVLTIGQQISESLVVHLGFTKKEAFRQAIELLEMVGIPEAKERCKDYPHQFSGGMRQRAMIAMALACNPKLLIADEPTTALDVTIQAQIIELVKSFRQRIGMAIIWITHDLSVIAELADRVLVMYAGYIVEETEINTLFEDPRHPYTLALLRSIPRVDRDSNERLANIPGFPPDCLNLPAGCPFAPRCSYTIDPCIQKNPPLSLIQTGHSVACWVDVTKEGAR